MYKTKQNRDVLYRAFDAYCQYYLSTLPSEDELKNITFSFQFKEKMARLVKSQKKPYYYMINTAAKRVACIIIAFVAVLTTLTFSVKALREPVVDFFLKTYRRFSIIFFEEESIPEGYHEVETFYAPTYVPEGFKQTDRLEGAFLFVTIYKRGNEMINFGQHVITRDGHYIDTEGAKTSYLRDGKYLFIERNTDNSLVWDDDDGMYYYILTVPSSLDIDEIFKIVDSIEEIK